MVIAIIKFLEDRRKRKYKDKDSSDKSFTAFIVRGNRQVIKREITASKKFLIGGDSYIIDSDCIFLKNVGGYLQSQSYYIEGNPKPFNFDNEINIGMTDNEINKFFTGDFLHIIVKAQREKRMKFIVLIIVITLVFTMINFGYTIVDMLIL